jgi:ATP-binding cassette subfamily C protein
MVEPEIREVIMQEKNVYPRGIAELKKVRRQSSTLLAAVFVFSIFVNLLMLTGPLYMLQVYDRVLSSRSVETLTALTVLILILFAMMGFLDWARGRVMARVGARMHEALNQRVFFAVLETAKQPHFRTKPISGVNDLGTLQKLFSSNALFSLFDMPWTPVFAATIFVFHPWLGILGLIGGVFLVVLSLISNTMTRANTISSQQKSARADALANAIRSESEAVEGLGMRHDVLARWKEQGDEAIVSDMTASDRSGAFSSFIRSFRLFLQSAMLGLGAYLVLQGELSPGAMIASSILLGRALAPIDQLIGYWPNIQRARDAWHSLAELLENSPNPKDKVTLPEPAALLEAKGVSAAPPGAATTCLRGISFTVKPGQAMGVIGQSASGKSSLARVITGYWPIISGQMRLGGATLDQYNPDDLGKYIGYLPQTVTLFEATIAENIARMSQSPDEQMVVEAAKKAGAHELILDQPNGYNTVVSPNSGLLTGGQRQRIGLARALYGNPLLLVLDEPNSALDSIGSAALNAAISSMKSENKSVIIMAHRPSAIEACDTLLVLENGLAIAFGPRDEVLSKVVKNASQIQSGLRKTKPSAPSNTKGES